MRVNHEADPSHPDNQGFVVSHVGLNNDSNWFDFREIDLDDQEFFRRLLSDQPGDEQEGSGEGSPRRFDLGMRVQDEIVSHFIDEAFLNPNDERVLEKILSQKIPGTPLTVRDLKSPEELRTMLREKQLELQMEPQELPVQPLRRRQALKKRLHERTNSVVNRVLRDLDLAFAGREVGRAFPAVRRKDNRTAVTQMLNTLVNERMGIGPGKRGTKNADDLDAALAELDTLGDELRDAIQEKIGEGRA